MKLEGERTIPATVERTWAALNDPETLKACIAGCDSLEKTADDEFLATMKVKIGPVNAGFRGKLKLSDIVPQQSYKIHFEGQGGAAGFGKGSADVTLRPDGDGTVLHYVANAQVGGKIAQIGSRLVDAAAGKIAEDFFAAFEARLTAEEPASAAADSGGPASAPEAATAPGAPPRPVPAAPDTGGSKALWWVVGIAVVAALAYWLSR